jgi:hypothetical protein
LSVCPGGELRRRRSRADPRETAGFFGLPDRGRLAPGLRADVNLIDFDACGSISPSSSTTCRRPAGASSSASTAMRRRLSGTPIFEHGTQIGVMPVIWCAPATRRHGAVGRPSRPFDSTVLSRDEPRTPIAMPGCIVLGGLPARDPERCGFGSHLIQTAYRGTGSHYVRYPS